MESGYKKPTDYPTKSPKVSDMLQLKTIDRCLFNSLQKRHYNV